MTTMERKNGTMKGVSNEIHIKFLVEVLVLEEKLADV